MNDLDFIKAAGIGMKAERIKGHRQRNKPGGSDGKHDGNGMPLFLARRR